ncbi:MAG: methyltransferase domain-containing protein, partial [Deltaproteobacteria bacterium]|nr:methyltransferase domain-containing protein [Deltaproteobacteria bacterium]
MAKTPDDRGALAHTELQLDWDADQLTPSWPSGPDTAFVLLRTATVASDVTAAGAPRRVLEVAAAEAVHACRLSAQGIACVVLEPSTAMLAKARQRIDAQGAAVVLVRGVAETLPFADASFDRVLIDSAIDHLGHPELSLREMTRVLRPDGRLVITFVNYGGLSARLSRAAYRLARGAGLVAARRHLPWDSPVPIEHTFECTLPVLTRLCRPGLELEHAFGMSIGWLLPGWGAVLARLGPARANAIVQRLDRLAQRWPRGADLVVSVWRPSPSPRRAAPARGADPVRCDEIVYTWKRRAEAAYWAAPAAGAGVAALARAADDSGSAAWLDDLRR